MITVRSPTIAQAGLMVTFSPAPRCSPCPLMAFMLFSLLLLVCVLGLPAPSEQKVKVAAFNIQVFGRRKSEKREVMDVLTKIIQKYDGVFILEVRDSSGRAFSKLLSSVNAGSQPDRIELVGTSAMRTKSRAFERPPDCFSLIIKETGLKMGALAVHIDPDDVVREMEALYTVAQECQRFSRTTNLVILGDMNADCSYLPKQAREALHLRTDYQYRWLITDGMDTTVAKSDCAYDRVIVRGSELTKRIPSARPSNFEKTFKLSPEKAKEVSDHYPVEFEIY